MQTNVLDIKNLNKTFRVRGSDVPVLRALDFSITRGEFVSIVGASGCGKSTILRIIAGLEKDYQGQVLLDGAPVSGPGLDRGFVFQDHRLFPWLTVRKNIAFGIERTRADRDKLVQEHIRLVGLKGFENAYPGQLSGGMAQRAAIARAIVNRPELLLLDEPFGALDAFTKIAMQEEMLRIWGADKTTMVLVTHDIDEAVYLSDRVFVMSNRPGTIRRVFKVDFSRPRDRNSPDFIAVRQAIFKEFFTKQEQPFAYAI